MIAFLISSDVRDLIIAALALIMVFAAFKAWQGRARRVTLMPPPDDHGGGHGGDHGGGGHGGHRAEHSHHYKRPRHWWQRMNPHSKRLREVIREGVGHSKPVVLVHPFHWMWHVVMVIIFLASCGVTYGILAAFSGAFMLYVLASVMLMFVFAFYYAGFRSTQVVNASVVKDRDDLTGEMALAGSTWAWPHFDYDRIDLHPRRTVYLFAVVLFDGLRLIIRMTTKWKPSLHIVTDEGENKFYEQGKEAIEESVVEQGAELSDTLSPLNAKQFNGMRSAAQLLHSCVMKFSRDKLPHYNSEFLELAGIKWPDGCVSGQEIPFAKRVEFYHLNRSLILKYIDREPGGAHPGEESVGETVSWFEENHGIEVESAAFLADFDDGSQEMLSDNYVAQLVRDLTGKQDLKEDTALAIAKRSINIKSTGGGMVATLIETGANVSTHVEKGH